MKEMKENLKNWNFMRLLRLAIGISMIVYGIIQTFWMIVGIGILYSFMTIMNISACGVGSCPTSPIKNQNNKDEITYEEIH